MKSANELSLSATDSGRRKLMGLRFSLGGCSMIDREFPVGHFCNAPAIKYEGCHQGQLMFSHNSDSSRMYAAGL
jgi:hypothetical protein